MRIVETMVPRDGRGPPTNSDELYFSIRDLFPHVPPENDVLGRTLMFCYANVPVTDRKESQSHRALNKIVSSYSRQTHSKKLSPQIIYSKDPNMAQIFDAA